ncbi:MAG: polysaccharide biosynthesis protein [Candidatus Edwardsbacteria bacterium]|nr:polysaccharide biosynthesis protein [Candidatus Edwardsbacteria bacterium]
MLKGKTILVTGGTGSFGHQIVSAMLQRGPAEVRIFSRDEKKQDDMRFHFGNDPRLRFIIGDVRDRLSLIAATVGAQLVFHAAALKQVPSCEENVIEAVLTNTLGAANVIEACIRNRVQEVVAISTDKAVKPVNAMGMTKALQERLFIAASLRPDIGGTEFQIVRYGNVLGSRGSVVPLFKKQLERGVPLTVTDRSMTRFLLTLDEAIGLVFTAMKDGVGGEIFVQKSKALSAGDLADVMARSVRPPAKIREIGARSGEKMHEVLISEEEALHTAERRDHFVIIPRTMNANTARRYRSQRYLRKTFEYSSNTAPRMTKTDIGRLLKEKGWLGAGKGKQEVFI